MSVALVITSIASPDKALKIFAQQCKEHRVEFIVIGDRKSPADFHLDGCRFVSIAEQKQMPFKIAQYLPENHYSKKNLGYLLAKNCATIIETDDDNYPKENFWDKLHDNNNESFRQIEARGWANAYKLFTRENIWPRGFPLENSNDLAVEGSLTGNSGVRILQGLSDENPDVDAVYRIAFKLPFNFQVGQPVLLNKNQWCPFSSQNTTWYKEAFLLMYLPSFCTMRMTDIWRSFIAQRILWTCDWQLAFHSADVIQKRNEHDLLKDFEEEIPGYLNNDRIKKILESLDLKNGKENIAENMLTCYKALVDEKIFPKDEMKLLEAWLYDITN